MTAPTSQGDVSTTAGGTGQKYYGKYRGVVLDNADPMLMGRILAIVPDVSTLLPTTYCMPCVPAAGLQAGMLAVPSIGAGVWIEFEQGDPDYPIWSGCYWGSPPELPLLTHLSPPGLSSLTFQTTLQNGIVINDVPGPAGGIILKSTTGAMIIVNDTGIYLSNGQGATITMLGPTVAINVAGLVVT
ncbi:MAG TPA: phage baseplate assembly protein V [Mycobacterium sp.]|nr:phage baseplate assembly protein V [Mycobacterium sp.]